MHYGLRSDNFKLVLPYILSEMLMISAHAQRQTSSFSIPVHIDQIQWLGYEKKCRRNLKAKGQLYHIESSFWSFFHRDSHGSLRNLMQFFSHPKLWIITLWIENGRGNINLLLWQEGIFLFAAQFDTFFPSSKRLTPQTTAHVCRWCTATTQWVMLQLCTCLKIVY